MPRGAYLSFPGSRYVLPVLSAAAGFDTIRGREESRILLLGCGAVGAVVARHLAGSRLARTIVAADMDLARAKAVARTSPRKVRPLRLELTDRGAIEKAARGSSLVINAAHPKFNLPVMEAALEADADYLDLAGGGNEQLALHGRWQRKGRTALLGMGEDPGLSNVFARHAADALDEVTAVRIRDGETARSDVYPFVFLFSPEVFIEETLAPAVVFERGRWRKLPRFSGREDFRFPLPVGTVPVYNVAHEEVETLPRFLGKRPRSVDFKLALLPDVVRLLRWLSDAGWDDPEMRRSFLSLVPPPASLAGRISGCAVILVEVTGRRDSAPVTQTTWAAMDHERAARRHGTTGTAWLTGTGAAAGALLVLEHAVEPGVLVPEQLRPDLVLARLKGRDVEVRHRVVRERVLS